jgi:hypothetical protein
MSLKFRCPGKTGCEKRMLRGRYQAHHLLGIRIRKGQGMDAHQEGIQVWLIKKLPVT